MSGINPLKRKFLIVANRPQRVAVMQKKGALTNEFNVDKLRAWLKHLGISDYDVAYSNMAKVVTWEGPIIALGDYVEADMIRLGKWYYKLPHPTAHSTTYMERVLNNVKDRILNDVVPPKKSKVRVVK
jgi:hypothetical protein